MITKTIMNQIVDDIRRITGISMRLCTQDEMLEDQTMSYHPIPDSDLQLETSGPGSEMAAALFLSELSHIEQAASGRRTKASFLKDIILGNVHPASIAASARKLHITFQKKRAVFLVDVPPENLDLAIQVTSAIFSAAAGNQIIAISADRFALIRELSDSDQINELGQELADTLRAELLTSVYVASGSAAEHLGDLQRSYQEASTALTISSIFTPDNYASFYDKLGLGRLIYSLDPELCRTFLQETFGRHNPLNDLDHDTQLLIHQFFDHNLNITDTAKALFLHRNTLIYRLEKIKEQTGFDIRHFDDAMTFRIAMLVNMRLTHL